MNLCARHRGVNRNPNGRPVKVLEFLAGNPNTCPYCLVVKDKKDRKRKK